MREADRHSDSVDSIYSDSIFTKYERGKIVKLAFSDGVCESYFYTSYSPQATEVGAWGGLYTLVMVV